MPNAIIVNHIGGPDVLTYAVVEVPVPGPGEALIRQHACGVNFIDIYYRSGVYPAALPLIPGSEAAGEVIAVGEGVTVVKPGDRVAYAGGTGGYATERLYKADRLVQLPADMSYEQAAASMLKGLTAHYLLRRTFPVGPGHVVLVHAAAGGVGLILCQWAKALGAMVIGTVGSPEKAALARQHGADHTILYRSEDWVARVAEITNGEKCHVVYDGIGKDTYPGSLDCLRPLGLWVTFGNASGVVEPVPMLMLSQRGSLFATRPTLSDYIAKREDLLRGAEELFAATRSRMVSIAIDQRYRLSEARKAHEDLEARRTTGCSVLVP